VTRHRAWSSRISGEIAGKSAWSTGMAGSRAVEVDSISFIYSIRYTQK
jgi:hypothetical protein